MFHRFYATTKDKSGKEHNFKLSAGEGVPIGHEITDLSVAGRFKFADVIDKDTYDLLMYAYGIKGKGQRAKA
jgi:hypothetical protein